MHWFERKIRRYEHRRWTTDDNRRVQPFHWGLEHIGGSPNDPNPAAFVREYARKAIDSSPEWYAASPATDYRLDTQNVLTFTSSIESSWPENNTVHAQLFPAHETVSTRSRGKRQGAGPAVLLLPNWNAKWHGQNGLCRWIQRLGITVLKMSMPYHDRRMADGHERADELREYWAPISPMPYVERGMGAGRTTFMVYGKYDPTMLPELTRQMLDSLRRHGAEPHTLELACGHYSLELAPFSYIAGYRMLT